MLNADSVLEFRSDTATNTVMKKTLDAAMEKFVLATCVLKLITLLVTCTHGALFITAALKLFQVGKGIYSTCRKHCRGVASQLLVVSPGPFYLFCSFIFRNERNSMKLDEEKCYLGFHKNW